MKKAFITWINGQDWAYLSDLLLRKWYIVLWLVKNDESSLANLEYFGISQKITLYVWDLRDQTIITTIIRDNQPDEIYHLWWLTSPGESRHLVSEYISTNTQSIVSIILATLEHAPDAKIFNAATSEMFWNSHDEGLQTENTPLKPTNPYAVTKLFAYRMANIYRQSHNLFIVNGILFNHESPLRPLHFVTRKITDGVARIAQWLQGKLVLGNLDAKRDRWYAGDFVEGIRLSMQQDISDTYIFSTWYTNTIKDILDIAFGYVGIDNRESYVVLDPAFNRPINLTHLYGKNDKAKTVLWREPKTSFQELIKMMMEEDMRRVILK